MRGQTCGKEGSRQGEPQMQNAKLRVSLAGWMKGKAYMADGVSEASVEECGQRGWPIMVCVLAAQ